MTGYRGRKTRRQSKSHMGLLVNVPHTFDNSSPNSFADDLLCRWSMFPRALTPHENTILLSLLEDRNVCSLDKHITLSESAISHYPDDDPSKTAHLFLLGMALEKKGLEEEALGVYERTLDGATGDSSDMSLMNMRFCFDKIGDLLKARYDRLGEAEDLDKAIWVQEMRIACTAADGGEP